MKYEYVIIVDPDFPAAAKTLDDAINYVKKSYNIINPNFNFEKNFPYDNIKQSMDTLGVYNFGAFDSIMTVDNYVKNYLIEV